MTYFFAVNNTCHRHTYHCREIFRRYSGMKIIFLSFVAFYLICSCAYYSTFRSKLISVFFYFITRRTQGIAIFCVSFFHQFIHFIRKTKYTTRYIMKSLFYLCTFCFQNGHNFVRLI
jgi:hypothetical protein